MMQINKMLLTPNKYSRPQIPLKTVTKIAVHYVGGAGSKAVNVRNYFNNLKDTHTTYASSHYIVGLEGEIIQCIPENEYSYCTNQANGYSISIENCHPKADGKFTEATRKSLIELCADICKRYNLDPIRDIIRHYDVTGKACPLYWVNHPDDYVKFKNEVKAFMTGTIQTESEKTEEVDDEMVETIKATINGKEIKADAIVKDDLTYIKMKSLENAGFEVGFVTGTKMRTLKNTIKEIPIVIDGEEKSIEAVNIGGFNYVPVRSIAAALGKEIDFKDGKVIISNK